MNELEEKLKCALADVGSQVGEILRCMVEAEIASQLSKVQRLQDILTGSCDSGATTSA